MTQPIASLLQALPPGTGAVVSDPISRRYLTGFPSSGGFLLAAGVCVLFLTDSRYVQAARECITVCPTEEFRKHEQVMEFFQSQDCSTLLFERKRTTLAEAETYRAWTPGIQLDTQATLVDDVLSRLRMTKSAAELTSVRKAQAIAETALEFILQKIRPGITEASLALELDYSLRSHGAQALAFDTIVVSGENSAKPHGVPGGRRLQTGDMITMDFGAVVNGWHSDMTRTVALGRPNEEQRLVYSAVLEAQLAALAAIAPGVDCKAVDAAARNVIQAAGYADAFRHGTGHGVGLEIHEAPTLSPKSETVLAPGQVVTVEPGIYLPDKFGVRIEDMVWVTEDGCENLTRAPKELLVL
ncbi:MAG: Xaa-Pro peptidase family protein [Oscillospiraceae bacterium]|nr:Xaa-Pro peptidase family protein [Oscillospiraceae bacterium]